MPTIHELTAQNTLALAHVVGTTATQTHNVTAETDFEPKHTITLGGSTFDVSASNTMSLTQDGQRNYYNLEHTLSLSDSNDLSGSTFGRSLSHFRDITHSVSTEGSTYNISLTSDVGVDHELVSNGSDLNYSVTTDLDLQDSDITAWITKEVSASSTLTITHEATITYALENTLHLTDVVTVLKAKATQHDLEITHSVDIGLNLNLEASTGIFNFGQHKFTKVGDYLSGQTNQQVDTLQDPNNPHIIFTAYRKDLNRGKFRTYNMHTFEFSDEVEVNSHDTVDPALLWHEGKLWMFYSTNTNTLWYKTSTDRGQTWSSSTLIWTAPLLASEHYEDLSVVGYASGVILLYAEYETSDKSTSAVHQLRKDVLGSWTFEEAIPPSGTIDHEGASLAVHNGRTYRIAADNADGGETYENNILRASYSDDEGLTWSSWYDLLDQMSHVEYNLAYANGWKLTSSRNYYSISTETQIGVYDLPSLEPPKLSTGNNWSQDIGTASIILLDDGSKAMDLHERGLERPFLSANITSTNEVDITAQCSGEGSVFTDIRIWYGTDYNNHYLVIVHLNRLYFFERSGGTYTELEDTTQFSMPLGQKCEIQVTHDSSGDYEIFVDGVSYFTGNDTTHTTFTKIGFSGAGFDPPQQRQPNRCYWVREDITGFYEDWSGYTAMQIVDKLSVGFGGACFEYDDKVYMFMEDRDNKLVTLYEQQEQTRNWASGYRTTTPETIVTEAYAPNGVT